MKQVRRFMLYLALAMGREEHGGKKNEEQITAECGRICKNVVLRSQCSWHPNAKGQGNQHISNPLHLT